MTLPLYEPVTDTPRPVGLLQPDEDHATRAVKALEEKRFADAQKHIETIADHAICQRTWQFLLRGRLLAERGQLSEAEPLFLQAAAVAFIMATDAPTPQLSQSLRLCAAALHFTGWTMRRRDRPHDAYRTHLTAWKLREDCGSLEEMWETALNLGLDADLSRHHEQAQQWYRRAIEFGVRVENEPQRRQALAWSNLASSLCESGHYPQAVEAAHQARDFWNKHDREAVTAVKADMFLATTLIKQAPHLSRTHQKKQILDEGIHLLAGTREALLAFGSDFAMDAQMCLEQQDFAERFRASLEETH